MQPLVGLPKTGYIKGLIYTLKIENHKIVSLVKMFKFLLKENNDQYWNEIISQMISQGFKLDGVIQCCIKEIQNVEECAWIFTELDVLIQKDAEKLSASQAGRKIAIMMINGIEPCKNWKQFHDTIHRESDFIKKIRSEIMEAIAQCNH